jgi:hypothetical protein
MTSLGIGVVMDLSISVSMAAGEIGLGYGRAEREGDGAIGFDLVRRKCDHRIKMNGPQNWIGRWPRWERKLASQDFV